MEMASAANVYSEPSYVQVKISVGSYHANSVRHIPVKAG